MKRGKITGLREGYGFIRPQARGGDVFFLPMHVEECEFCDLQLGMEVEYEDEDHAKGRRATEVHVLAQPMSA
jgi:cold shock CspA family protein